MAVASMAAGSFGYANIYNIDLPLDVFLSILLILTIGILGGNFFNLFFLKYYDKGIKKLVTKNAAMIPILTGALFVGMYSVFSAPTLTNFKNPVAIITFIVAALAALVLGEVGKKHPKLKEYAFSLSLLAGMIGAGVSAYILK
jgi:hypothetical protein